MKAKELRESKIAIEALVLYLISGLVGQAGRFL